MHCKVPDSTKCPHCKRKHPWDVKDAWLDHSKHDRAGLNVNR